jgi:hypothetical protein
MELFNDEKTMVRLDMSEYVEAHTVYRLIGAPPGCESSPPVHPADLHPLYTSIQAYIILLCCLVLLLTYAPLCS